MSNNSSPIPPLVSLIIQAELCENPPLIFFSALLSSLHTTAAPYFIRVTPSNLQLWRHSGEQTGERMVWHHIVSSAPTSSLGGVHIILGAGGSVSSVRSIGKSSW